MSGAKFTLEDLEALNEAIAKGVRRVKYTDKEIEYRSLKEMLELRNLMKCELGCSVKVARVVAQQSKGLGDC